MGGGGRRGRRGWVAGEGAGITAQVGRGGRRGLWAGWQVRVGGV